MALSEGAGLAPCHREGKRTGVPKLSGEALLPRSERGCVAGVFAGESEPSVS